MSAEQALILALQKRVAQLEREQGFPIHFCEIDEDREIQVMKSWHTPEEFTFESVFPIDWRESPFGDNVMMYGFEDEFVQEYIDLREACKGLSMEEIITNINDFDSCSTTWFFLRGKGALDGMKMLLAR